MGCDKNANKCMANISQRDTTIFLLFVDLIISVLCVFLFISMYFCYPSDKGSDQSNLFLYIFFIWHASKLVIVSLGIVGSLKKVPSYLIPYICYWILLTSFLLLYTLFVMIVSVTKIHNTEDAADLLKANETSTSYPLPTNKIFEPSNVPHLILEFSLNNVALIAALFLVITVFSSYFTSVVCGFYSVLKEEVEKLKTHVAESAETTNPPTEA